MIEDRLWPHQQIAHTTKRYRRYFHRGAEWTIEEPDTCSGHDSVSTRVASGWKARRYIQMDHDDDGYGLQSVWISGQKDRRVSRG